jgi:hypothetical protein
VKNILFVLLLLIVGSSSFLGCDLLTVNDDMGEYPTTYHQIELAELEALNEEYHSRNEGHICSTLNEYGLTGYSEILFEDGVNPCASREAVRIEITDTDTLTSFAKKVLLGNQVYTGVEDTSALELKEMEALPGCTICEGPNENRVNIEWKLVFKNQKVDAVEVMDTEITVFLDAKGVNRIWGNWYPGIKDPEFIEYGYEEVQAGMAGWQVDMRSYSGSESIYTIREEDLTELPRKTFLPYEEGDMLKVRACWRVPVLYNGEDDFTGWMAYIDIEEGFLVDLKAR